MRAMCCPPSFELPLFGLTNSKRSGILVTRLVHKEGIMTCTRCQGYMAEDHFLDLMESAEDMWLAGWRCLNCGHVLDPVMERNRRGQGVAAGVSTVREPIQKEPRNISMSS
jgi:hypothetical protein